jgi:tetratricopeptide (TPR) repeat protein
MMTAARRLEQGGNTQGALEVYRQALGFAVAGSGLARELELIVDDLEAKVAAQPAQRQSASVATAIPTAIPPAPPPASPAQDIHPLFLDGASALRNGQYARAREMLAEVVRLQPDYAANNQKAAVLLREAERRLRPRKQRRPWPLIAALVAVPLVLVAAALYYSTALNQPPTPVLTVVVIATAPPIATPPPPTAPPATAPPTAVQATPTPTLDQVWQAVLGELDATWTKNWPQSIALLDAFRQRFPDHQPSREKLYSALVFRGEDLLKQGKVEEAIPILERARSTLPGRDEANAMLLALTPTPEPTPEPTEPPVAPSAPRAPAPAPRAPAPAPAPAPPPVKRPLGT